jgi:hypothetical protein
MFVEGSLPRAWLDRVRGNPYNWRTAHGLRPTLLEPEEE